MTVGAKEEEKEEEEGKDSTQQRRDDKEIMQMLEMRDAYCTLCHGKCQEEWFEYSLTWNVQWKMLSEEEFSVMF